jgi:hypothetical protein
MGIRDHPIALRSPWQNGHAAERLIGSIRRECLDHVVVFGEPHLRRILAGYAVYYNAADGKTYYADFQSIRVDRLSSPHAGLCRRCVNGSGYAHR